MIAFTLSLLLAHAGAAPQGRAAAPAPVEPAAATHIGVARLRVSAISHDDFAAALALRVPDVTLHRHDSDVESTPAADALLAYVAVAPAEPDRWDVTIVVSDGRAFDRVVDVEAGATEGDVTRLLANHVANLLLAIEAGTVPPDREDVAIPPPLSAQPPTPVCPKCPPAAAPRIEPKPQPGPPSSALELGVGASPVVVLGLGGASSADRFAATGGELVTRARLPGGAALGLDVRVSGRGLPGSDRLVRARFALAAGYVLRRERFELDVTARVSVEPWWVVRGVDRRPILDSAGRPRPLRPLVGGSVGISPRWLLAASPRLRIAVGPRLELGGSTAPGDGGRVAVIGSRETDAIDPVARVGGFELVLGADVVLWIPARARRAR